MGVVKNGEWYSAVALIDQNTATLYVRDARGNLVLQGLGEYRWRPDRDPGDEQQETQSSVSVKDGALYWNEP